MPMNVVVVMDPIGTIKIAKDSTFAMLLEAQKRGHALHYVVPGGLGMAGGVGPAARGARGGGAGPPGGVGLGPG